MTKDELNEIIKFLTEECARKILDLGDVFIPYNIYPDDITEEEYMEEVNPTSLEIFNYYSTIRGYFINQLLALENKELTEEEYDEEYEKQIWHWDGYLKDMQQVFQEEFYEDDDSEEENETVKELTEQIDILTEECIKKIVDEIGCADFDDIMVTDEDYGYDNYGLEDFEIEALNSPQYKQAKVVYEEYIDKRHPLIEQLVEVRLDNGLDCDEVEVECEYESDFVCKFEEYINTTK
jgi:hypothetical protein